MVAKFSIAVSVYQGGKDETIWMDCECWGKTAEITGKYLRKGSKVAVTGSLKQESWVDKNTGQPRTKLVVRVDRLELLGSKDGASDNRVQDSESRDDILF